MNNHGFKWTILTSITIFFLGVFATDQNVTNSTSEKANFCPSKLYTISFNSIEFPLYTILNGSKYHGELVIYITRAIDTCCKQMRNNILYNHDGNITHSDDIEVAIRTSGLSKDPKLFFPVFADANDDFQFGREFIGFYKSPGLVVLQVGQDESSDDYSKQLQALLKTWPIVGICILAAMLAGLFLWVLDCRSNKDFSTGFINGAGAGVWWSFVTMTTVGYGDKSPRTFLGRFFGVVWMITGTILLSMLSAQITAYLASLEVTQETFSIQNKKIAVPLGIRNYLEQELNLGATYTEYPRSTIMEVIKTGNKSLIDDHQYIIVHDLDNIKYWIINKKATIAHVEIKTTITHRIDMGVVFTNKPRETDEFLQCWKRNIKDDIALDKLSNRSAYANISIFSTPSSKSSSNGTQLKIIVYMGCVAGGLVVIGLLWEFFRSTKCKTRSAPVSNPS